MESLSAVSYASFAKRFAAFAIDSIIVTIFTLTFTYYNVIHWKNFLLFALVTLIGIFYKPFLENKYGASIGKMILKIEIKNSENKKTTPLQILLRNIFNILPGLISIYLTINIFNQPAFAALTTYKKYAKLLTHSDTMSLFNNICMVIYFIDVLFIWMDDKNRSLHDRIGNTLVVNCEKINNLSIEIKAIET